MNQMAAGEPQVRKFEAAERLARLALDHSLKVTALLSTLARELFDLDVEQLRALAAAEEHEAMRLRVEHLHRTTARFVDCARHLTELGSETRGGFSRLLTEQLASGRHDLMDAFQGFFAVLPAQNPDLPEMLALVRERTDRAFGDIAATVAQAAAAPPPVPKRPRAPQPLQPDAAALMADAPVA